MTDQELKDLVASLAVEHRKTELMMQETDRLFKEWREERKEADRKWHEERDRITKQMGGIDENQGNHAEQYFQNVLREKLTFCGQKYDRMIANMECSNKNGDSLIEFDIVLINGKSVAIIETKNRIRPKFVKQFVEERLPKFREFWPEFSKCKAYLGIAGFSFSNKVLEEAEKYGVCIVRQVGDSIEVKTNNLRAY